MSIKDTFETSRRLVEGLQEILQNDLPSIPSLDGKGQPAIYLSHEGSPVTSGQYMTVQVNDNADEGGAWKLFHYVDEEDKVHQVAEQRMTFRLTTYGRNSSTILTKLKMYLLDDTLRGVLNSKVEGTFQELTSAEQRPEYQNTHFINTTFTDISFVVTHDWTSNAQVIENAEITLLGDEKPKVIIENNQTIIP